MQRTKNKIKLHMLATVLVLAGAINWGSIGILDRNLLKYILSKRDHRILVYVVIGLSALYLIFQRDTFLPFLGQTTVPCSLFPTKRTPKDATREVRIITRPNSKIVYWAADKDEDDNPLTRLDVWKAYGDVDNSGITTSDKNGVAVLKIREPQSYIVNKMGRKKVLAPHIHYRVCRDKLMMGPVETVKFYK